jgi:hypothetical protein
MNHSVMRGTQKECRFHNMARKNNEAIVMRSMNILSMKSLKAKAVRVLNIV